MCVIDVTACYVQIHPNGPSENFSNWNVICEANNHRMKQGEIAIREFTHITLNGADVFRSEWATQKPEFHFSLVIELDEIWIWKRAKKLYSRFTWCCCCKNEKSTEWDDKTRSACPLTTVVLDDHASISKSLAASQQTIQVSNCLSSSWASLRLFGADVIKRHSWFLDL